MRLLLSCLLVGSVICGPVDQGYGYDSAGTSFIRQPFSSGNLASGVGVSSGSGSPLSSVIKPISSNTGVPAPQDATSSAGAGSYPGTTISMGYLSGAPGGSYAGGYDGAASARYRVAGSAPAGSYASGYNSAASAGYGFDSSSVSGGSYDGSAGAGYGFDSSVSGGSYDGSAGAGYGFDSRVSGGSYDGSASAGYGFDSSVSGGSYDRSAGAYAGDAGSSGSYYGYDAVDDLEPVFSDVSDLEPVYASSSRSSYQRGRVVFGQRRYAPEEPVPQQMPVRRVGSKTSTKSSPKAPTKGAF